MISRSCRYLFCALVMHSAYAAVLAADIQVPGPNFRDPVDYLGWFQSQVEPDYLIAKTPDAEIESFLEGYRSVPLSVRKQLEAFALDPRPWGSGDYPQANLHLETFQPILKKYVDRYFMEKPLYLIAKDADHLHEVIIYAVSSQLGSFVLMDLWLQGDGPFNRSRFVEGIESVLSNAQHLKRSSSALLYLNACRLEERAYASLCQAARSGLLAGQEIDPFVETIAAAFDPNSQTELELLKSCFAAEKAYHFDQLQMMVTDPWLASEPKFDRRKVKAAFEDIFGADQLLESESMLARFLAANPADIANTIDAYFDSGVMLISNSDVFGGAADVSDPIRALKKDASKAFYFQVVSLYDFSLLYEQLRKTRAMAERVTAAAGER